MNEGPKSVYGPAALRSSDEERVDVFERDASTFAGCRQYMFKHALLRDVAYESLLRRQRRSYHGAVADWLVETGGDRADEIAGLVGSALIPGAAAPVPSP